MTRTSTEPVTRHPRRVLGRAGDGSTGPTVVFVAGVHGNEPSGVLALERVFARLEEHAIVPRGVVLGLSGNLQALAAGRRYLDRDLNRMWSRAEVARVRAVAAGDGAVPEDRELRELLQHLEDAFHAAKGPVTVVDLHSASSRTAPFVVLGDTLHNRRFGRRFPTPVILGLEEQLVGTLMEYVTGLGHTSLAVEGGQNEDPRSVDHHEAAIWLALVHAKSLAREQVRDFEQHRRLIASTRQGVPRLLEILHRHEIRPGDEFVMRPGYRNFQPVRKGEELARDRHGPVRSPGDYVLFLPLYQGLGSDGFFLSRAVSPLWLVVSGVLRRFGVSLVAPFLPGVRRHPELADTLLVDTRIARFLVPQLFHLMGYRVRRIEPDRVEARRRRN
ncbi:MAG: succinylglutamate desuccinylase/aspartoacylase family protein [Candidatus Eiseniibacteriota bacterium]